MISAAELLDPGPLEVVDRIGLGLGQRAQAGVEGTRVQVRVRGRQGTVRPAARLLGQGHRALQERGRPGEPGACLGALRGRSSSAATASSGPVAAAARCQTRRSGSVFGSITSARARCAARRSSAEPARTPQPA